MVYVVSKTHLDLGFTDYAENIRKKYINEFIPNAVKTARAVNKDKKNFVWTTGSWIIKEALQYGTQEQVQGLKSALKNGDIVPHALPFTMHTELLDLDSMEYALSIVDEIDKICGRKTVSAKMTDVPGYTKSLVTLLANKGIKLLHIGVNGASALADVPACFLWKNGNAEIVVIYSGEYGGAYECEYIDDVLYFDHTLDNHGAGTRQAVLDNIENIKKKYPDFDVVAASLDDYADSIWKVRDKLPVITSEIGDTWIHGSASDPYKSAALRTLIRLKNKWLKEGTFDKNSVEYINLADNILCLAEHTCGMDVKIALNEYENYLRPDFEKARGGNTNYKKIEKSWAEQRQYIEKAVQYLSERHKTEMLNELNTLLPVNPFPVLKNKGRAGDIYKFNSNQISVNSYGGISFLNINGKCIISKNDKPCITYDSLGSRDYDYWFEHYTRNLKETADWSLADFGKPNINKISDKYMQGRFSYLLSDLTIEQSDNKLVLLAELSIDEYFYKNLGAPQTFQIKYTLDDKLSVEVLWMNKKANRLPESIMLHIYPEFEDIVYSKLGEDVNPFDIVKNGNRNLAAVEKVTVDNCEIVNYHSPVVGIGKGEILHFDNEYGSIADGLTYVLYNNIWGTNFPLWYSDNAYFKYDIKLI